MADTSLKRTQSAEGQRRESCPECDGAGSVHSPPGLWH